MAWVVPMTVVIWVYAEREQAAHETVVFRVEAKNNDPDRKVVELIGPGADGRNFTIRADLSGPQAGLLAVKKILESGALRLETASLDPGHHADYDVQQAIDPLFAKLGVSFSNVSPAKIDVFVDPIVQRDDVVVKPRGVTNLEDKREFTPAKVTVTGPKSVLDAAEAHGNLVAYAELGDLQSQSSSDAPSVRVTVPISDPHINVIPTTVTARTTEVAGFVSVVPVFAQQPTDRTAAKPWVRGMVDVAPVLHFIPVTGPAGSFKTDTGPDGTKQNIYPPDKGGVKAILDLSTAAPPVTSETDFKTTHTAAIHFDFGNTGLKLREPLPESLQKMDFTYVEHKLAE